MHSSTMYTVCCSGCLSCHACPPTCMPPPCMPPPLQNAHPLHSTPYHACPLCHTCPFAMHNPFTMLAPPPPVNRIIGRCKNITFPQLLLRTVKMMEFCVSACRQNRQFSQSGFKQLLNSLEVGFNCIFM